MTSRRDAGFTLLEVLVALAILGLAVVAAIQGFAQGLRLLKLSGDHQQAMLIADLKAREVVALEETHEEGTEGNFQWERTTRLLDTPDLVPANGAPPRFRVWEIAVRVRWDERRQVEVTTLRTAVATSVDATARGDATAPGTPPTSTTGSPATSTIPGATTSPGSSTPGRSMPGRSTAPSPRSSGSPFGPSVTTSEMR